MEKDRFFEERIDGKVIFDGKVVKLEEDNIKCANGVKATREVIRHPGAVCIIAQVKGCIILEKQYRYPFSKVIYELPAGKLNRGEDIFEASIRELEEETGYKALNTKYLGKIYPSPAYTDEVIHIFYADNLVKTKTNFDSDEYVEISFKSLREIYEMIEKGEINDAKTICALHLFSLKYGEK